MQTKTCNTCGIEKQTSEFNYKNKSKGYLKSDCKECENSKRREKRVSNPEYFREQERERSKRRPSRADYNKQLNTIERQCECCKKPFNCRKEANKSKCNDCIEMGRVKLKQEKEILKQQIKDEQLIKTCQTCGTVFKGKKIDAKYCSDSCFPSFNRSSEEERTKECHTCGEVFVGKSKLSKYCSDKCSKKAGNRTKEMRKGTRAEKMKANGRIDRGITIEKLIKRDGNHCYICDIETSFQDCQPVFKYGKKIGQITGLKYPTIEHVIAIDNGGTHTWDNVKVACFECNSIKSNKELELITC